MNISLKHFVIYQINLNYEIKHIRNQRLGYWSYTNELGYKQNGLQSNIILATEYWTIMY